MSYPAKLVAYAFVKKGIEEDKPVTQMQLQKMVYFAHGLHLALYEEPLIEEKFQAWKFGPVIPSIYSAYRIYGSEPITDTSWIFSRIKHNVELLDKRAKYVIDYTWKNLNEYSAAKLSNWTHQKDSPWDEVYEPDKNDKPIPNPLIKKYFKRFVVEN